VTAPAGAATAEAIASVVADARPAMVARLIRVTGDWDLAEDCVQDAVERALQRWPRDGVPRTPVAWLTTVARNRALDVLRRRQTERAKLQGTALLVDLGRDDGYAEGDPMSDDVLRLLFTCCHPALALEARVALTLRTVAGLGTAEIARAFLVAEPTLSQRLLRAKQKIAHAGIPYRVPDDDQLPERTSGVLAVLYLVLNEGYGRPDDQLAREALRLCRLVVRLMPDDDEARGLLALGTFHLARRATRFDAAGDLVPMEEQDRSRWDSALLDEGRWHLRRAASGRRPPGTYRLQAEIAACHASAGDAGSTPWARIVTLYDALLIAQPTPVVALNRAVAVGFRDGYDAGLAELDVLERGDGGVLRGYYLLPAARADFHRRAGRSDEARCAYEEARALVVPDGAEARLIGRRLAELDADT
jgi:RNA polymerase sigma-70 factor (ECF subfamily)